ncbi:conserved hypothetical protein [Methylocella tundrae]|uniref:Uncharacterized protein n=1 Tax=Methylocella tundrae TaxID=227605 RepID=A0A8B6M1L2_METTU|nr:hypothetical protein [Methylocella tundrae]VTZ48635.1 conserved hypothetical protein [Methylocella tundrae]
MVDKDKTPTKEQISKDQKDEELEHELEDSFPASDPPSMTQPNGSPGAPDHDKKRK